MSIEIEKNEKKLKSNRFHAMYCIIPFAKRNWRNRNKSIDEIVVLYGINSSVPGFRLIHRSVSPKQIRKNCKYYSKRIYV